MAGRRTVRRVAVALLLLAGTPGLAQPVVPATEPDPARLAAATRLVDVVMPPALRDKMIEQTASTMVANMNKLMLASPQMTAMFEKRPAARPILERFLAQQAEESRTAMREMMPAMMTMMARYYARQLSAADIDATRAFFATPAGKAYAIAAGSVMADPEFATLLQGSMAKAMARIPARVKAMTEELRALDPAAAAKAPVSAF